MTKQVVWRAVFKDGKILDEFEKDETYNDFREIKKEELIYFSLINNNINSSTTINLIDGTLILGGVPVNLSLEKNFRNEIPITFQKINYGKHLFWYNESFAEFTGAPTSKSYLQNVFFGYEIPLDIPYESEELKGTIISSKLLVSINVNNNKIYFSQKNSLKTNINDKDIIIKI